MTDPTTDVAVVEPTTGTFAERKALCAALAQSDIAPAHFRNRPANVLLVSLAAEALDLDLFTAMQELYVVQGKIGMSAGLTATLVRKAGHRLRVLETTAERATIEIVRHDDPEAPFRVTWTMQDAKRAGLSGGSWNKYPAAMLVARATTACARLACPEALSGVGYTPDELGDDSIAPEWTADAGAGGGEAPAPASAVERSTGVVVDDPWAAEVVDAEIVEDAAPEDDPASRAAGSEDGGAEAGQHPAPPSLTGLASDRHPLPTTEPQMKAINAIARKVGAANAEDRNLLVSHLVGYDITSLRQLGKHDATRVIDALKRLEDDPAAAAETWAAIAEGVAIHNRAKEATA